MTKKLIGLLLSAILIPAALFAQSGKVAGKVTDSKTGEALALANVIIEGTTFGAATNDNGEFVILNVAPGTYTIKARYLGYSDQSISNIVVNASLTKTVNFKLTTADQELQTVEVIAERALINPNVTNSNSIKTAEDIENLPVRGVNNIVALQGGLVSTGGNIYVRGGRADETAFIVDGVNVTGALAGGSRVSLIDNAIEEIQVQTGGHGAEYGGANGGVVSTSMKTGGSTYKFGAEFLTDGFSADGKSTLVGSNGFSRGYNEGVASMSGPIPFVDNLTFFAAGRLQNRETPAEFWDGYDIKNIPGFYSLRKYDGSADSTVVDTINASYPNYRLDNERNQIEFNGNLVYNFAPFSVKYSTTLSKIDFKSGSGLANVFNRDKVQENTNFTQTHSLKISQTIDATMFYTLTASMFNDYSTSQDPTYGDDVVAYGNPDQNPNYSWDKNKTKIYATRGAFQGPGGFSWTAPGASIANFGKTDVFSWTVKGDFVKQIGRVHELKGGFEYTKFTIRNVTYNPVSLKQRLFDNPVSASLSEEDQTLKLGRDISANAFGYDIYGNEVDGGLAGAKKPVFAAVHLSDKLEYQDLILSLGLRYDYIDNQSFKFTQPGNSFSEGNYGYISESSLTTKAAVAYVSPRIGLSLPVTDKTTFTANFGKYVQQTNLNDIYLGWGFMSRILLAGGNAFNNPVGFDLDPTRTTSYEVGFKQQITDNAAFDLTAFYNNKEGQVQLRTINGIKDGQPTSFYALQNGDFSTASGVQFAVTLRRSNRIQANFNYTYSDARGTGSSSTSQFRTVWLNGSQPFFPNYENSITFNQTHSGSAEVDYRFSNNDGPEIAGIKAFENLGVNILYTFNSGHPYTRFVGYAATSSRPTEAFNSSSTPFVSEINLKIDKSFKIESFNLNAYVRVQNLFNDKNVLNVFGNTGDDNNDGYLRTEEGVQRLAGENGAKYGELYNSFNNLNNPGNYNSPRTIVLGLKLDF